MTKQTDQTTVSLEIQPPGNAQIIGDRENQQDYFATLTVKDVLVAVVADGMGGYRGGDQASEQALKTFIETLRQANLADIPKALHHALDAANSKIKQIQSTQPDIADMGTTLVALIIDNNVSYWISVGDSPLYRLRNSNLERLNANHAIAEELNQAVVEGTLSKQQALDHPDYHLITSALSGTPIPLIDCPDTGLLIQPGDCFLIASDGIHTLSDSEIEQVLTVKTNAQDAADRLIKAVKKHHEPEQDNCTIVTLYTDPPEKIAGKFLQLFTLLLGLLIFVIIGIYFIRPELLSGWFVVGEQSSIQTEEKPAQEKDIEIKPPATQQSDTKEINKPSDPGANQSKQEERVNSDTDSSIKIEPKKPDPTDNPKQAIQKQPVVRSEQTKPNDKAAEKNSDLKKLQQQSGTPQKQGKTP